MCFLSFLSQNKFLLLKKKKKKKQQLVQTERTEDSVCISGPTRQTDQPGCLCSLGFSSVFRILKTLYFSAWNSFSFSKIFHKHDRVCRGNSFLLCGCPRLDLFWIVPYECGFFVQLTVIYSLEMMTKIFFLLEIVRLTQLPQFSFLIIFWVSHMWRPRLVLYQGHLLSQFSILDFISSDFDWSNCVSILSGIAYMKWTY